MIVIAIVAHFAFFTLLDFVEVALFSSALLPPELACYAQRDAISDSMRLLLWAVCVIYPALLLTATAVYHFRARRRQIE